VAGRGKAAVAAVDGWGETLREAENAVEINWLDGEGAAEWSGALSTSKMASRPARIGMAALSGGGAAWVLEWLVSTRPWSLLGGNGGGGDGDTGSVAWSALDQPTRHAYEPLAVRMSIACAWCLVVLGVWECGENEQASEWLSELKFQSLRAEKCTE
jgi:hypothetical protein